MLLVDNNGVVTREWTVKLRTFNTNRY